MKTLWSLLKKPLKNNHPVLYFLTLGRLSSLQNVTLSITKYLQMSSSFLCSEPLSSVSTFSDVLHTVPFYFNLVLSNESYTGVKRTLEIAHYRKYLKHQWPHKIQSDTTNTPYIYSKSWGKNLVVRRIEGPGIVMLGLIIRLLLC